MATTVTQAFREFRSNLEITDYQESLVSRRRANVVKALGAKLRLHGTQPSLVTGSWDRHTLTRHLAEGDVDVMAVLHYGENKGWENAEGAVKALDRFRAILQDAYPNTTMRRDRNCVTMQFSDFRLDVVPAFRYKQGYYTIPDSVRRRWVETDPIAFAEQVTAVNKAMDDTFVPLIKMVKGWNRDKGWPIRSFHLECMLHHHYRSYTQRFTYPSTLKVFFGALPGYLSEASYDPVRGDRVDTYLDNNSLIKSRRQIAIDKAKAAATAAKKAYDLQEDDVPAAIRKWKALLGEFFPAYG